MQQEIHPEYFPQAKAKCACGASYEVGSTLKSLNVEICQACHPFFTGKDKLLDTAGRVEKFKRRRLASQKLGGKTQTKRAS